MILKGQALRGSQSPNDVDLHLSKMQGMYIITINITRGVFEQTMNTRRRKQKCYK